MGRTQKNKATNYHLGTLKAKIAILKRELINGPGGKSAGSKDSGRGFDVTKSGDTRIGLVGFPSVGKSTLLTSLTGTRSEAAAYEFTTLTYVMCANVVCLLACLLACFIALLLYAMLCTCWTLVSSRHSPIPYFICGPRTTTIDAFQAP
jgi:hypothetical protein